jgi:hypothetical protein
LFDPLFLLAQNPTLAVPWAVAKATKIAVTMNCAETILDDRVVCLVEGIDAFEDKYLDDKRMVIAE